MWVDRAPGCDRSARDRTGMTVPGQSSHGRCTSPSALGRNMVQGTQLPDVSKPAEGGTGMGPEGGSALRQLNIRMHAGCPHLPHLLRRLGSSWLGFTILPKRAKSRDAGGVPEAKSSATSLIFFSLLLCSSEDKKR